MSLKAFDSNDIIDALNVNRLCIWAEEQAGFLSVDQLTRGFLIILEKFHDCPTALCRSSGEK